MSNILTLEGTFKITAPNEYMNLVHLFFDKNFQKTEIHGLQGEVKYIVLSHVEFPKSVVKYNDKKEEIEEFLQGYRHSYFLILTTKKIIFVKNSPREKQVILIFPTEKEGIYKAMHGESMDDLQRKSTIAGFSFQLENRKDTYELSQSQIQYIFEDFILRKRIAHLGSLQYGESHDKGLVSQHLKNFA